MTFTAGPSIISSGGRWAPATLWPGCCWSGPVTWLRAAGQDRSAGVRGQSWRQCWHAWVYGRLPTRQRFRGRLLDINAYYWLASRAYSKPAWVWGVLGLVAAGWAWGAIGLKGDWYNEAIYYPTAILLNSILKVWIASEAGRQLSEDRRSGALELVLCTPMKVKDILLGQLLALRRQFLGPLLMVMGVELVFLAASLQRESFHAQPINPTVWLGRSLRVVVGSRGFDLERNVGRHDQQEPGVRHRDDPGPHSGRPLGAVHLHSHNCGQLLGGPRERVQRRFHVGIPCRPVGGFELGLRPGLRPRYFMADVHPVPSAGAPAL